MTNFIEEGYAMIGFGTDSEEMGDYLQWQKPRDAPLGVDFSWSPRTFVTQACGTVNIAVPETLTNTQITFTLSQNHPTNMIANPLFANDTVGQAPANWTPYTTSTGPAPTITVNNTWSTKGGRSVTLNGSTGGGGYDAGLASSNMSVYPNTNYVFGADFNVIGPLVGGTAFFLGVSWYTSTGTFISQRLVNNDLVVAGVASLAYGATSPANAAYASLQAFAMNSGANVTVQFDIDNPFFAPAEDEHYIAAVRWDFGDGTSAYYSNYTTSFSPMLHTFTNANFQNVVTMIAIDNYGNEYVVAHQNYLVV